jgi:hypothetical protein
LQARNTGRARQARCTAHQQAAPLPAAAPRRSTLGQPPFSRVLVVHNALSSRHGKFQTGLVVPCARLKRPSERPSCRNVHLTLSIPRQAYKRQPSHKIHHTNDTVIIKLLHKYILTHILSVPISSTQQRSSSNSGLHLHDYRLRLQIHAVAGALTAPHAPVAAACRTR